MKLGTCQQFALLTEGNNCAILPLRGKDEMKGRICQRKVITAPVGYYIWQIEAV